MARAPSSISQAIRGFPRGEDRTTAVFAAACVVHHAFGQAVLEEAAGARIAADSIEANLQVLTPAGRRVDLELVGRSNGTAVRVWIEAKWDAVWQPNQLADYAAAIADRGTLLALIPAYRAREVPKPFKTLTWEHVAVLADQQGIATAGQRWRDRAYQPDAAAQQRVLALFLDHLETEHQMATSPLLTEHALAIRLAGDAITISDALASDAIRRAGLHSEGAGYFRNHAGAYWTFQQQAQLAPVWHPEGWPELMRSPNGAHQTDGPPEPVFLCGYSLPKPAIDRLEAPDLQNWRTALAADTPRFLVSGGRSEWTRVFTALPLAALATASASFDGQAQLLGDWIRGAFDKIQELDPGVIWKPA